MNRTVITKRDVQIAEQRGLRLTAGVAEVPDDYKTQILKYIPAETVTLYLALDGIVRSSFDLTSQTPLLWVIFLLGLVGTPLYLWRITGVKGIPQLALSTIAFVIWVFALGGIFATFPWYKPVYGALALPIFTFFAPLLLNTPAPAGARQPS